MREYCNFNHLSLIFLHIFKRRAPLLVFLPPRRTEGSFRRRRKTFRPGGHRGMAAIMWPRVVVLGMRRWLDSSAWAMWVMRRRGSNVRGRGRGIKLYGYKLYINHNSWLKRTKGILDVSWTHGIQLYSINNLIYKYEVPNGFINIYIYYMEPAFADLLYHSFKIKLLYHSKY